MKYCWIKYGDNVVSGVFTLHCYEAPSGVIAGRADMVRIREGLLAAGSDGGACAINDVLASRVRSEYVCRVSNCYGVDAIASSLRVGTSG